MAYLEQFARNRRRKEKTEVLTARLPKSLYEDFKTYCDELGLSISEAVCLLVEREIEGIKGSPETSSTVETNTINNKKNDDETNTNTSVVVKNTNRTKSNTKRFTTMQWQINGQLPCPICDTWSSAGNFAARHSNKHGMTTEQLFTNEQYKDKINAMITEKKATEGI